MEYVLRYNLFNLQGWKLKPREGSVFGHLEPNTELLLSMRSTYASQTSYSHHAHAVTSVVSDSEILRTAAWQGPLSTVAVLAQPLSRVRLFATSSTTAHHASLSFTNSWSLRKLMSMELVTPPNRLILCLPLLLPSSIFPSIRVFSNESVLRIRWPKYWSFSFSISPSNERSGLISFRMDWLDLLAVQGTLKNLFQHHSSKASILQHSAFFIVQPSHPYMTTGKTIALTNGPLLAQ